MAISATAGKKETQFLWEGKDKRGNKVLLAAEFVHDCAKISKLLVVDADYDESVSSEQPPR